MKKLLLFSILFTVIIQVPATAQSFYLGKTSAFIKQEKGDPFKIDYQEGETIYLYKKVDQKGKASLTMYYFNSNSQCVSIVQDFEMWFLIPWTDELNQKYKRLDTHNWIEKESIIHAVSVIDESRFIYIIKYKE